VLRVVEPAARPHAVDMALLLIIAYLLTLAILAPRFGRDSRDYPRSAEETLAHLGVRWDAGAR